MIKISNHSLSVMILGMSLLRLPSWKEPDYSKEDGEEQEPAQWHISVTAHDLEPDNYYKLFRYNDTKFLPNGTRAGIPDRVILIRPDKEHQTMIDTIMSDSATHYRCIKVGKGTR